LKEEVSLFSIIGANISDGLEVALAFDDNKVSGLEVRPEIPGMSIEVWRLPHPNRYPRLRRSRSGGSVMH
jgi:hypothetical protein